MIFRFFQRECKGVSKHSEDCINQLGVTYWKTDRPDTGMEASEIAKFRQSFRPLSTLESYSSFLNSSVPDQVENINARFITITFDSGSDRNVKGIYLAFKGFQSCSFLKEVKVWASYCPDKKIHLAQYPRTWIRENPDLVPGHCVSGAKSEHTSRAHCLTEGKWENGGAMMQFCKCTEGFEPNGNLTECTRKCYLGISDFLR